jgi:hypothetical protein
MRNWNRLIVGVLALALAATACDPYEGENTGTPSIAAVFATDGNPDGASFTEGAFNSTLSRWEILDIPSTCHPDPTAPITAPAGSILADQYAIFATANKLLSGPSIEQAPAGSCLPALTGTGGTPWLTATPTPVGQSWFSCYFPSSPSPNLGGSVVMFKTDAYSGSWNEVALLEGITTAATTYTMNGTVSDQQGNPLALNVTATVAPGSLAGQTTGLRAIEVAGNNVNLTWGNAACGGTPTYSVQRTAAVAAGASCPSTFTTLQAGLTTQAYTDSTITTGSKYCYRVFVTVGTDDGPNSSTVSNVPAAPAAPTFTGVTSTSVTVNWTAVPGALTYTVQRAPDVSGAPGTWGSVAANQTGTSYNDATLTAATTYWYRLLALGAGGTSAAGASASVTTP